MGDELAFCVIYSLSYTIPPYPIVLFVNLLEWEVNSKVYNYYEFTRECIDWRQFQCYFIVDEKTFLYGYIGISLSEYYSLLF